MLNREKYSKEILDIACSGHSIALDSDTNEVCSCNCISCSDCEFSGYADSCCDACEIWCNSKYIPEGTRLHIDIEYNSDKINMSEIEELLIDAGYKVIHSDFENIPKPEMKKLMEESPAYIEEA